MKNFHLPNKESLKAYFLNKSVYLSFFLLLIVFLVQTLFLYDSHKQNNELVLKNETLNICNTLEDIFDYTEGIIEYISKEIALEKNHDLKNICKLLGKNREGHDNLSWLNIGWIDKNGLYLFDRQLGFIKPPYSLSHREYFKKCIESPGIFHTSEVVIGPTGTRKIPGGIGIVNNKFEYLGIVCIGLNLVDLNHKVQQKLLASNFQSSKFSYIVLDNELNIALQSSDNNINIESKFFKSALKAKDSFYMDEGILPKPILYKNIAYSNFKKLPNSSYWVLTGTNSQAFKSNFLEKMYPLIIEILFTVLILIIHGYFNNKLTINKIKISEFYKISFLKSLKDQNQKFIESIQIYCDVLIKNTSSELDIKIDPSKQYDFLKKINEEITFLKNFTTDSLEYTDVNINKLIFECTSILYQNLLLKTIKIELFLCSYELILRGDEVRLKQIILNLILLNIEFSPENSVINIYTSLNQNQDEQLITIIFEDTGFAIGRDALVRMQKRNFNSTTFDNVKLDFLSVEQLVKLHGGELKINSKWNKGKSFILYFPYHENIVEGESVSEYKSPTIIDNLTDTTNVITLKKE